MKPVFADAFNSLPTPLARSVFRTVREATALRPRPALAFAGLIDSAEIAIQLSAFSMTTLADRFMDSESESSADAIALFQDTLLAAPLSLGHYVQTCTVMHNALQKSQGDFPPVLVGLRDSLATQIGKSESIAKRFAEFPGLRNRKKGHTFTLQDTDAQKLWDEWWPRLDGMLQALASIYNRFRLFTPQDNFENTYEVAILHGPQDISTAPRPLIETNNVLDRSSVYLCPSGSLESGRIGPEAICLTPLVRELDGQLYLYQGRRGKRFMYLSAEAVENNEASSFESQFLKAFPNLTAKRSTARLSPPKWHAEFPSVDILCEASVKLAKPRPDKFYRGSPCSWADLSANLDTPRTYMVASEESLSLAELFDSHLKSLLLEAEAATAPLLLLRGPAGSGKSTALGRIGFYIWERSGANVSVARLRSGASLAPEQIQQIVQNAGTRTLVLLCDDIKLTAEELEVLRKESRHQDVPLLIIAAERTYYGYFPATLELALGTLNDDQISTLIDQLGTAGMLGALASLERAAQHSTISDKLERQLFITMYEAVHASRFEEVIADEFARVPSQSAKRLYASLCISECAESPLGEDIAFRMTGSSVRADFNRTWKHLAGVARRDWFDGERVLRARHALIADAVLRHIAGTDVLYDAIYEVAAALSSAPGDVGSRKHAARRLARILSNETVIVALDKSCEIDDIEQLVCLFAPGHLSLLSFVEPVAFSSSTKFSLAARKILPEAATKPAEHRYGDVGPCYRMLRGKCDHDELAADLFRLFEAYASEIATRDWVMDQSMCLREALALCSENTNPDLVKQISKSLLEIINEIGDNTQLAHCLLALFQPCERVGLTETLWEAVEKVLPKLVTTEATQAITLGEKLIKSLRTSGEYEAAIKSGLELASALSETDLLESSARGLASQLVRCSLEGPFATALDIADKCSDLLGVPSYGELAPFAEIDTQGELIGPSDLLDRLASVSDYKDRSLFAFRIVRQAMPRCPNLDTLLQFLSEKQDDEAIGSTLEAWVRAWQDCYGEVSAQDMATIEARFPELELVE